MDRLEQIKQWAKNYGHGRADSNGTKWLISEVESLRTQLGQLHADIYGMQDGSLVQALRQQLAQMRETLKLIIHQHPECRNTEIAE